MSYKTLKTEVRQIVEGQENLTKELKRLSEFVQETPTSFTQLITAVRDVALKFHKPVEEIIKLDYPGIGISTLGAYVPGLDKVMVFHSHRLYDAPFSELSFVGVTNGYEYNVAAKTSKYGWELTEERLIPIPRPVAEKIYGIITDYFEYYNYVQVVEEGVLS